MHDEEENFEDGDFHVGGDEDLEDLEEITDFGLDEEDPDKDH